MDETAKASGTGRPTGRVSKRDWLEKALEVFVSGGVDAVKIVDLARQLNMSKCGFYWRFRDRADLLEAMKLYWVEEFSRQFIEETFNRETDLRDRLISLVRAILNKHSGNLDLAFTAWAQSDPSVRELVDRVRDMRIAFIKELLSGTGLSDGELTARARILVVCFSWSEVMFDRKGDGLAGEDIDRVLETITGG